MILLKTYRNRHFRALLKLHGPSNCFNNSSLTSIMSSTSSDFLFLSSNSCKPFSHSAQFSENAEKTVKKFTEPLSVFVRRALRVDESTENCGVEAEDKSETANSEVIRNSGGLKEKLRNLEEEVRSLNKNGSEMGKKLKLLPEKDDPVVRKGTKQSLSALFSGKKTREVKKLVVSTDYGNENPMVHRELSSDMQMFTHHLYMQGYLKDASFMPKNKFDFTCFEVSYAREFLKFAAVNFGKDHQEIVRWLSAGDMKKIALFGCPSLGKRSIHAAKHMRRFFQIEEHQVCRNCTLKESCKYVNKISKKGSSQLHLASVTKVLVMYAMESVPQKLVVPEEIKNSVSRLLKEIISLTQKMS